MRIVVVVKHVAAESTPARKGTGAYLDEADEVALDQAGRIARRRRDVEITALVLGPAAASGAVRKALAAGADAGVHVLDPRLPARDPVGTSRVLAKVVDRLPFDLVLFGSPPADAGWAMLPAMLGERLGVPALCFADSLRIGEHRVEIGRDDGFGPEVFDARLPAVVSVTERCGEPGYQRFGAALEAGHKLVRTWSLGDDEADDDEDAGATTVHAVVPMPAKHCTLVAGDAPAAAFRIADFLAERQLL